MLNCQKLCFSLNVKLLKTLPSQLFFKTTDFPRPPYSLDLNLTCFFSGGYMKEHIYVITPPKPPQLLNKKERVAEIIF